MHQRDQVGLVKCVLAIAICSWCSGTTVPVDQAEPVSGGRKIIPSRQCYLLGKAIKRECRYEQPTTAKPNGWTKTASPRIKVCQTIIHDKIVPLPQTTLDPRVDSLEFPSIILNSSYHKMRCIWTSKASARHRYYVAVEKLIAHNAHNVTKLCLHIDKERRTCQKGSFPAKLPVAVTTRTGRLHIKVELIRGDAQETSVNLTGRYTEVQISTHVPGHTTTAQPLHQTELCLNKTIKTNLTTPQVNYYYFDPVKEDCIKFRRGHSNRASRYTGHGFKDMTTCRQRCVFRSMKVRERTVDVNSSGDVINPVVTCRDCAAKERQARHRPKREKRAKYSEIP